MKFFIGSVCCELSLITRLNDKVWVGLLIDSEVRCVDCVICFCKSSRFVFHANGITPEGYRAILLRRAIEEILTNNYLEEL